MASHFSSAFLISVLLFSSAEAYETDESRGYIDPSTSSLLSDLQPRPKRALTDGNRYRKFKLALDALQIPYEEGLDYSEFPMDGEIAQADVQAHLNFMDPDGGLRRYIKTEPGAISLFQDFFSKLLPQSLLDYTVQLNTTGQSEDSNRLLNRLSVVEAQVKNPRVQNPLTGLKIVIDPGHMGTAEWDQETGKFVQVNGIKVSEGQLNLWTALLTANALEELGATVVLTRTRDGTVTSETISTFDSTPFIHQYFYNSLDDWMGPYLEKLSDADLPLIRTKTETKRAYTAIQKSQFFMGGEDLEARSRIIDEEKPDVVLDIHYDANRSNQLQNRVNSIEAFVPGAFRSNETGSRKVRGYAMKHLLEVKRWNESVSLAGEITQSISDSTKLPLLSAPVFMSSVKVRDGVYARNLYINRRNLSALTVYLECLHYDHVSEFSKLAQRTESGIYRGTSFQYPARLNFVADGIRTGLLNYFKR